MVPRQKNSRDRSEQELLIGAGGVTLKGMLAIPTDAHAVVLFAHGSGSKPS